jgi:predicted O-methyltransferase YrrM|tara:strand:- start:1280 stop:2143 length:864 start_codon:yes stop_codon:yes gene_type:complete
MLKKIKKKLRSNIYTEHFYQLIKNLIYSKSIKNNPFGKVVLAKKEEYLNIYNNSLSEVYDEVDNYEKETGFKINEKWLNDLALHTQVVIKESKICYAHGRLIYSKLRQYINDNYELLKDKEICIVETGTSRGFSSLCMAKALKDANIKGKIYTIDIIPNSKKFYWNCIDDLEGKKTRLDLLSKWSDLIENYIIFLEGNANKVIKSINMKRFHFAFLDASHTYFDVKNEFIEIANKQEEKDIIIFDDYTPNSFNGLIKAANYVCKKFNYSSKNIKANKYRGYLITEKN